MMNLAALAFAAEKTYPGLFHLGQALYIIVGVIVALSAVVSIVMNIKNGGVHPWEKAELEELERERAALEEEAAARGESQALDSETRN